MAKYFPNPEANWGPKARAQPTKKRKHSAEDGEDADADADGGEEADGKAHGGADSDSEAHTNDGDALQEKSKANQGKNIKKRKKCRAFERVCAPTISCLGSELCVCSKACSVVCCCVFAGRLLSVRRQMQVQA